VYSDTHGRVVDETTVPRGPWITLYDRTKWQAHFEVAGPMMQQGLPLVVVQPGVVYGPGDTSQLGDLFHRYLQGKVRAIPRDAEYCWAHVDDIARGHLLAMEKGRTGEAYHLAGPRHSLPEAFALAAKITGIRAPRTLVSRRALRFLAAVTGSETLRAAPATYLGNAAKATRELGWSARPLEEGLGETLPYEMRRLGVARPALTSSA
jgi:nucleoside-diphosphate-sugar epimerase